MKKMTKKLPLIAALSAALSLTASFSADAAPVLTPAAQAAGFQLSTIVSGIPNTQNTGAVDVVSTTNGNILVSRYWGEVRSFSDTDNQTWADGTTNDYGSTHISGLATAGGNYYLADQAYGFIQQVNADGSYNQHIVSVTDVADLVGNPVSGHLYASGMGTTQMIFDIDPAANTFTVFNNVFANGLGISPDGSTLYMVEWNTGQVLGFDTGTKALVFDSGFISGQPIGLAVGSGPLAGNLFVDTIDGNLFEVNLATKAQTLLFTGGSGSIYMDFDSNDGSLLITQADSVLRLTPSNVPEPGSLALLASGFAGLIGSRQLRKTQNCAA